MSKMQPVRTMPSGLPGPGRGGRIAIGKPKNARKTIRRLWYYLRKHRTRLLLVVLFVLINTSAQLTGSYLLRPIINNYILPGNYKGMVQLLLVQLAVYLVGVTAAIMQSRIMIVIAQKTVHQIRADLFSKLQTLPIRFFDSNDRGEIMSRFTNDVDNISESLNNGITQIIASGITLIGTFALMLYISPLLMLVTLVMVPLMLLLAGAIIKKSRTYFLAQQVALGTANGYIEEIITDEKVVKVFHYETHASQAFAGLNNALQEKATKAQFYSGIMIPVIMNVNTINFALTATVGGVLAVLRGLDIGGLASYLQYARQFGRPVNEISNQFNSLQAALASAERVFEVMDQEPEAADAADTVTLTGVRGEVVVSNVTFGYEPGKAVLKNISLQAKPGQKIAFVGSTGAGKTTIINLLPRFYDLQSGTITIEGIDIRHIQRDSLRKTLAMVLQDTHLFTGTVMENIRYGRLEATDADVIRAAKLANADSFIRHLPKGYDTVLEGDGANLSQGQRQLLSIARAAVADAPIFILDEATSSIDTRTEQYISQGMDQLMKGRTSFIIAHRLSTIKNADVILVLEHGEIIERGNHQTLLEQKGRYYQLYTGQFS